MSEKHSGLEHVRGLLKLIQGDEKHDNASNSTLDVLWVLHNRIIFDPHGGSDSGRDRFYLSKGHGPMALYAILVHHGKLEISDLYQFGTFHGRLGHHPDRMTAPNAVEISSGSLGHGLGVAVGTALALNAQGDTSSTTYVLVGDGEMDEGSVWEAVSFAGRMELARLHLIVVDNRTATHGWPGGLEGRLSAEGWACERKSALDHDALEDALRKYDGTRPQALIVDFPSTPKRQEVR